MWFSEGGGGRVEGRMSSNQQCKMLIKENAFSNLLEAGTRALPRTRPSALGCIAAWPHTLSLRGWSWTLLKGAASRYSVTFCVFLREQKMSIACASVSSVHQTWQLGRTRTASPPTVMYAGYVYRQYSRSTTSRARVALLHYHLSTWTARTR